MRSIKKVLSYIRKKYEKIVNYYILRKNKVLYDKQPIINGVLFLKNLQGSVVVGENVKINSRSSANPIGGDTRTSMVVGSQGKLIIGDNVGISNSAFVCKEGITIGNNVRIGGSCKIWDTDFHPVNLEERLINDESKIKSKSIEIKDGVWIGGSCIILKGVTIGENSIIAAGSVLTKSVPQGEVWGGNPAKFIKKI